MAECRSCGAAIIWAVTEKGRRIPIDAKEDPEGSILLMGDQDATAPPPLAVVIKKGDVHGPAARFKSHFATCPSADAHRKK